MPVRKRVNAARSGTHSAKRVFVRSQGAVRKAHLLVSGLLISGLVSGCASLAPEYTRPALPVPGDYGGVPEASVGAAGVQWRDYFIDPQLQAVIAQGLQNNRDLRLAVLRVDEARATYGVQRAEQWPTIGASADVTRSRTPADLSLTGRVVTGNVFNTGLGVSAWELDFWGRIRNLKGAALQTYLASEAGQQAAELGLISQIADVYVAVIGLDERVQLAGQSEAARAESLRILRRRVEVGSASRLELVQAEMLWQQARALKSQHEQARARQMAPLQFLVGAPVQIEGRAQPLTGVSLMRALPAGLPSDLLERRPDIVAAEYNLKAASLRIGAARAAFFPRISLTASGGTASGALDGLFEEESGAWRFAPSISLPLFDGGRNRNSLTLAEVRRDQAVATYEKTIQAAFRDVSAGLASQTYYGQQAQIVDETLTVLRERARLAHLRYDHGSATFLEVLDAERDLLSAEQQRVELRAAILSNQIGLYAALGGAPASNTSRN